MKVFYDPRMSVDSGGYSPSGSKPALCVADWQDLGIEVCGFEPVTVSDLCLAHDPEFVRGVMSLKLMNGHGNRLKSVTDSCLWTVGSMVAASRSALTDGITCSPSSGHHHSEYRESMMFCTYNGLIVAAQKMFAENLVDKVGILDLDYHWGNGTQDCIDKLKLHDRIKHWSFGGEYPVHNFNQGEFLNEIYAVLCGMKSDGCGLIIYQAGGDMHIDDPLGGVSTTEELRQRDQLVFEICSELGMAVAYCHAGGYMRDEDGGISGVLEIHRNTAVEAIRVLDSIRCVA